MALSSSSSAVRSPEMARRISGPRSCRVRRPAWAKGTGREGPGAHPPRPHLSLCFSPRRPAPGVHRGRRHVGRQSQRRQQTPQPFPPLRQLRGAESPGQRVQEAGQEGRVPLQAQNFRKGPVGAWGLVEVGGGARPPGSRAPHLQGQGVPLGGLAHQALLFALLELPEILLDQESSVKLAHRDLVI